MAVIAIPAALKIRSVQWRLEQPAQVNRSQWTGRDQVIAEPWHYRWSAEVQCPPVSDVDAAALRAFFVQLKGRINTMRLPATDAPQTAAGNPVTTGGGAAAGATSVALAGLPASTTVLAGRFLTISDQLLVLTADMVVSGGGAGTATFAATPLRAAVSNGVAAELRAPTALVALAENSIGWAVDPGSIHGFAFSVEERF